MKLAEPASTAGAGALVKLGSMFGAGILAGLVMLIVDPAKTRKEQAARFAVAGIGSMTFGGVAVRLIDHYFDWYSLVNMTGLDWLEMVLPVYLIVGALSWAAFGALARFGQQLKDRGGQWFFDKFFPPKQP